MGWFGRWCRNVGLMVHHIRRPDHAERRVIQRRVDEEQRGAVTLRRTTIEEIEIRNGDHPPGERVK